MLYSQWWFSGLNRLDLLIRCSNAAVEVEKLEKLDAVSWPVPYGEGWLGIWSNRTYLLQIKLVLMYWVTLSYWVRLWIQIILSLNQARADKRSRQNTEMTWGIPQLLNQIEYIATQKAEGGQYDPFPYTFYNTKVWSCYRAHSSVEILFYAHFRWTFSMLFYICT